MMTEGKPSKLGLKNLTMIPKLSVKEKIDRAFGNANANMALATNTMSSSLQRTGISNFMNRTLSI